MSNQFDFFDTNALVAVTIEEHVHHEASLARLGKLSAHMPACAAHSLAEVYTTLTRPNRYGIPPNDVARIIEQISLTFKIVLLTPAEYLRTIKAAAALGLPGAIIYDALLMAAARKIDARYIYTHNVSHFKTVAPDLAARIRIP